MPTKERWAKMSEKEKQKYTKWQKQWRLRNTEKWNKYQREYTPTERMALLKKQRAEIRHIRIKHCSFSDELTQLVHLEAIDLRKKREQSTGIKWHIDHVIPLNGRNVCGLHVWSNLAVIPAKVNLSKGNKEMTKFLT